MAEQQTAIAKKEDVGTQVIARVQNLVQAGFTMPADYNYINAIKASMLVLSEMRDKEGKLFVDTCTKGSIQTALFMMVTKGLDVSKNQAYFIKRGDKLCLDDSYFGKIVQVRRVYPNFDPKPRVIYKNDEFAYTTDLATGRRKLVRHEQSLENIENDWVGAYLYVPCADGGQDLFIMTKQQILTAWSKSPSRDQSVHKLFFEKMIDKTIINSACNIIINATPELHEINKIALRTSEMDDTEQMSEEQELEVIDVTGEVIDPMTDEGPDDEQ